MKPDPRDDTATLLHRLEGVSQILRTLSMDMDHPPKAALALLADVTNGLANGLMDRIDSESTP